MSVTEKEWFGSEQDDPFTLEKSYNLQDYDLVYKDLGGIRWIEKDERYPDTVQDKVSIRHIPTEKEISFHFQPDTSALISVTKLQFVKLSLEDHVQDTGDIVYTQYSAGSPYRSGDYRSAAYSKDGVLIKDEHLPQERPDNQYYSLPKTQDAMLFVTNILTSTPDDKVSENVRANRQKMLGYFQANMNNADTQSLQFPEQTP